MSILFQIKFDTSISVFAAKRKQLRSMGKGKKAITPTEEELFESGQLGDHSPEALI